MLIRVNVYLALLISTGLVSLGKFDGEPHSESVCFFFSRERKASVLTVKTRSLRPVQVNILGTSKYYKRDRYVVHADLTLRLVISWTFCRTRNGGALKGFPMNFVQ